MVEDWVRKLGAKAGVLSADEKANIQMGLTALSKTTKMIMNIKDPIVTGDHTFPIAKKQSLTPSVIVGVNYPVVV